MVVPQLVIDQFLIRACAQELQATYDRAWTQLHAGNRGADVQPWREARRCA